MSTEADPEICRCGHHHDAHEAIGGPCICPECDCQKFTKETSHGMPTVQVQEVSARD